MKDGDDGVENRLLEARVVADELVDVVAHLVRGLLLLEGLEVSLRGEDVDHLWDQRRPGGELVESGLVEAERSEHVGNPKDDLGSRLNVGLDRIVERLGQLRLLQDGERRRLVVHKRGHDAQSCVKVGNQGQLGVRRKVSLHSTTVWTYRARRRSLQTPCGAP